MDSAKSQTPPRDMMGGFGVKFYRYRTLLRRLWWVLALTIGLGVGYQAWNVYRAPQLFQSESQLHIREQLSDSTDSVRFNQERDSFIANALTMIKSSEVLERAQRRLALASQVFSGPTPEINPSVMPRTTIFLIQATGKNPEYTQKFLDAVVAEFIDFRGEQEKGVVTTAQKNYSTQGAQDQKELDEADARLQEFISKNNMGFWEQQKTSRAAFLSNLKNQQAELQTELQRLEQLSPDQLLNLSPAAPPKNSAATAASGATAAQDSSFSNELYNLYLKQTQDLMQAQAQLDERSKIWKPKHPKLIQLKDGVEQIKRSIQLLKSQNKDAQARRIDAIKADLKNLDASILNWDQKVLEASAMDAQYQKLQQTVQEKKEHLKAMEDRKIGLNGPLPDILAVLQQASPAKEVPKQTVKHLMTGLIGGLVLGALLLVLLDRTDDRLASSTEIMERFSESILGQIPNVEDSRRESGLPLLQPDDDRYTYAEAFRSLRSSLIFMPNQGDLRTLLVTSAIPSEGKSTVASNLAVTMAAAGARVVLVDADLRRGDLAALFDTDGRSGLSSILRGEVTWESTAKKTVYPSLTLIPRGPVTSQSGELLLLPSLNKLLEELKAAFDLVIFNTAPILATDDTPTVAPHFDGTLMITRAQFTSARLTQNALSALYQRQVNVLGLILNCVDAEMPDYYYYRYPKYYAA